MESSIYRRMIEAEVHIKSNLFESEEHICHNADLLIQACNFFEGGRWSVYDGAEEADSLIRMYLMRSECIPKVLDERI